MKLQAAPLLAALVSAACLSHAAPPPDNVFGTRERVVPALVGIFYDLKQTQQRVPIPDLANKYGKIIDNFLVNGLTERDLSGFFRAGLPLYTTQIYMPIMDAGRAPKAFGVEKIVKPSYWIVHYKGQIAAPEAATYRFIGAGDDVLIVAIDGKVVLNANLPKPPTPLKRLNWIAPADQGPTPVNFNNHPGTYGDWIALRPDQPVDIDIIVGERPGGGFQAQLLYAKQGVTYPLNAEGKSVLPLFQLAARPDDSPNYLTNLPPWRCLN